MHHICMYIHVITLKMFVCFHFYQESEFIGGTVSNQNSMGWMFSDTKKSHKMGQKKENLVQGLLKKNLDIIKE